MSNVHICSCCCRKGTIPQTTINSRPQKCKFVVFIVVDHKSVMAVGVNDLSIANTTHARESIHAFQPFFKKIYMVCLKCKIFYQSKWEI